MTGLNREQTINPDQAEIQTAKARLRAENGGEGSIAYGTGLMIYAQAYGREAVGLKPIPPSSQPPQEVSPYFVGDPVSDIIRPDHG